MVRALSLPLTGLLYQDEARALKSSRASIARRGRSVTSECTVGEYSVPNSNPGRRRARGVCVGVDLGTTNSVVAMVKDGQPTVVRNAEGERITPSAVAWVGPGDRDVLIGRRALNQKAVNPQNTFTSIKRLIGRSNMDAARAGMKVNARYSDVELGTFVWFSHIFSAFQLDLVNVDRRSFNTSSIMLRVPVRGKTITTEEATAQLLKNMLTDAEM